MAATSGRKEEKMRGRAGDQDRVPSLFIPVIPIYSKC